MSGRIKTMARLRFALATDDVHEVCAVLANNPWAAKKCFPETGSLPLQHAAINCHADIVRRLLKSGADPVLGKGILSPPLHTAARHGKIETIRILLAAGCPVDQMTKRGATPLQTAAAQGQAEAARLLVAQGALIETQEEDLSPLFWAEFIKRKSVADFLRQKGARDDIFSAIAAGNIEAVRRCVAYDRAALSKRLLGINRGIIAGPTPLQFALMERIDCIDVLLDLGADPSEKTLSGLSSLGVLLFTSRDDQPRISRLGNLLLEHGYPRDIAAMLLTGANADIQAILRNEVQPSAEDIFIAILFRNKELLKCLVEHGSSLHAPLPYTRLTPLGLAVWAGSLEIAGALLELGATPNDPNVALAAMKIGGTSLFDLLRSYRLNCDLRISEVNSSVLECALEEGNKEAAQQLLLMGAGANERDADDFGGTPLHRACLCWRNLDIEIFESLMKHGADPRIRDRVFDSTPGEWLEYSCFPEPAPREIAVLLRWPYVPQAR